MSTQSTAASTGSLFTPLRHGIYGKMLAANTVSNVGGIIQLTAAGWMMAMISDSANMVAWVQTSVTLPIVLFGIPAGAISDNFSRRNILLAARIFLFGVSALLVLFAYFDWITPWLLLGFTFLIGCGKALNNPSWQASVGDLLPREDIPSGVLLNNIGFNFSRSIAPAIGGLIVAGASATAAFAVNMASYVFMLPTLLSWKPEYKPDLLPRESIGRAIFAGVRYVCLSPNIGRVILRAFTFGMGAISILAFLPLIARDRLESGAGAYGVMLGAFGVGGVAGALLSKPLRGRFSGEGLTKILFLVFAGCAGVTALSDSRWLIGLAVMVSGACWVSTLSLFNTAVQLSTPRWVVGRALSIYMVMVFGGQSLGSWLWGGIAEHHGVAAALLSSGVALLLGAALGWICPLPKNEDGGLDPISSWKEPSLSLDIRPTSGPVTILVHFKIAGKDEAEFLGLMHERRRIHLRDGAHNWTLMRDLQQPEDWTISYRFPTWIEYVRHHQRITRKDAHVGKALRRLHQGEAPPVVTRLIERHTDRQAVKASHSEPLPPLPPAM